MKIVGISRTPDQKWSKVAEYKKMTQSGFNFVFAALVSPVLSPLNKGIKNRKCSLLEFAIVFTGCSLFINYFDKGTH